MGRWRQWSCSESWPLQGGITRGEFAACAKQPVWSSGREFCWSSIYTLCFTEALSPPIFLFLPVLSQAGKTQQRRKNYTAVHVENVISGHRRRVLFRVGHISGLYDLIMRSQLMFVHTCRRTCEGGSCSPFVSCQRRPKTWPTPCPPFHLRHCHPASNRLFDHSITHPYPTSSLSLPIPYFAPHP